MRQTVPRLTLLAATSLAIAGQIRPKLDSGIVGTWKLLEAVSWDSTGTPRYQYGEHPFGYFVYDGTGHLHIQMMRGPAQPRFASRRDDRPSPEELRTAWDGYLAYFGTYTVDAAGGIVTHHVEGSLKPSYTGSDQPRQFRVHGDTLVIGDGKTYRRTLLRMH